MDDAKIVAYHEAGHAVVNYRVASHAGGAISIVRERGILGYAIDGISDSFNEEQMEARILSCYAGGHAQRFVDPVTGDDGCETDDDIANELRREWCAPQKIVTNFMHPIHAADSSRYS